MKRMILLILISLTGLLSSQAQTIDGFGELKFGMSRKEVVYTINKRLFEPNSSYHEPAEDYIVAHKLTVNGILFDDIVLFFENDVFFEMILYNKYIWMTQATKRSDTIKEELDTYFEKGIVVDEFTFWGDLKTISAWLEIKEEKGDYWVKLKVTNLTVLNR